MGSTESTPFVEDDNGRKTPAYAPDDTPPGEYDVTSHDGEHGWAARKNGAGHDAAVPVKKDAAGIWQFAHRPKQTP
jgi:hypothetical protein